MRRQKRGGRERSREHTLVVFGAPKYSVIASLRLSRSLVSFFASLEEVEVAGLGKVVADCRLLM